MSWQSFSLQSSREGFSRKADTWGKIEGGAGKKTEIFASFSGIPVQTAWTASERACLAMKWATHSANESCAQISHLCIPVLRSRRQVVTAGPPCSTLGQALLQSGCASQGAIHSSLGLLTAKGGASMQAWPGSSLQSLSLALIWAFNTPRHP